MKSIAVAILEVLAVATEKNGGGSNSYGNCHGRVQYELRDVSGIDAQAM